VPCRTSSASGTSSFFEHNWQPGRLDEAQRNYLEEMLANELAKVVPPEAPMPPKDIDERN
jgi:hypothetical protein